MGHSDTLMTIYSTADISLNPCSNGWGTLTREYEVSPMFSIVLILVLMDGAL